MLYLVVTLLTHAKFEVFSKENLGSVRTVLDLEKEQPWFVGKDVCDILGIANARNAYARLQADEKGSVRLTDGTSPKGGNPNVTIVNESGLYMLIMKSRKKTAEAFQRWITREVLPSIRKTADTS